MKTFSEFVNDQSVNHLAENLVRLGIYDVKPLSDYVVASAQKGRFLNESTHVYNELWNWLKGAFNQGGRELNKAGNAVGRVANAAVAPVRRMAAAGSAYADNERQKAAHQEKVKAFEQVSQQLNGMAKQLGQLGIDPNATKGIIDQLRGLVDQGLQSHQAAGPEFTKANVVAPGNHRPQAPTAQFAPPGQQPNFNPTAQFAPPGQQPNLNPNDLWHLNSA